jgi:hypothetical protein
MLTVLNQRDTATQDHMSKTMARGLTPYPAPPRVHKTVTGPVFFPEKPDRLTEKCIFWSGWGTGNRPVWLTGRTGNTGYRGKSVGSQWIRTPWHHHLNCSTMAELGAQGARGGATVQGNAWRVAGTCA